MLGDTKREFMSRGIGVTNASRQVLKGDSNGRRVNDRRNNTRHRVVFARRNFNYKPGSKNWAINAEARLSDSEEANNIAYRLQEGMVNSGHRP